MSTKRTTIILSLIVLSILLVLKVNFFQSKGTMVTIRNQTNEVIENLVFGSNDNKEKYIIPEIDPHSNISFEYENSMFISKIKGR